MNQGWLGGVVGLSWCGVLPDEFFELRRPYGNEGLPLFLFLFLFYFLVAGQVTLLVVFLIPSSFPSRGDSHIDIIDIGGGGLGFPWRPPVVLILILILLLWWRACVVYSGGSGAGQSRVRRGAGLLLSCSLSCCSSLLLLLLGASSAVFLDQFKNPNSREN